MGTFAFFNRFAVIVHRGLDGNIYLCIARTRLFDSSDRYNDFRNLYLPYNLGKNGFSGVSAQAGNIALVVSYFMVNSRIVRIFVLLSCNQKVSEKQYGTPLII